MVRGEPNAGIPWRWDTMRHGAAGLLLAERLHQLRPASLFYRRQPPFLAIGDRIVAVYQRKDNDVRALYNVSDGGAFLKNHPCYPGDRQMSLVYNLFYGMVLVMYLLILGMSLNNPYKPVRGFGWLIQDSLDMLSLLLLSFGGITAVLELIGPTARLLSHRVADWMKMRSAMRHYLQGAARHTALEEIM